MPAQRWTGDEIRRAQELVGRIRGVSSCQVSTDEAGEITEIHVVATSDKAPKLIARDVESCLKAEMGLDVDHRKIGVVLFDQETSPPSRPESDPPRPTLGNSPPVFPEEADTVMELPVEEYASRFAFRSVNLYLSENTARAEVELSREFDTAFGSAQTDWPNTSTYEVIAEATLQAVSESLDESTKLCLRRVRQVTLDDAIALVVLVDLLTGRDRKGLVGASVVSGNENQTVVFATLDAVNRVLGKLDLKSSVEYKIK
jgi:hypothetical protein